MAELVCPKCGSDMRSYERNGITVDQCTGCRGIFLDRGELERLTDAEGSYYERDREPEREREREPERRESHHRESHHYGGHHKKKRKKSFLDDFLDFG